MNSLLRLFKWLFKKTKTKNSTGQHFISAEPWKEVIQDAVPLLGDPVECPFQINNIVFV